MLNVYTAFSQALYSSANSVQTKNPGGSGEKQVQAFSIPALIKTGNVLAMLVLLGAVSVQAQDSWQPLMDEADQSMALTYNVRKDVYSGNNLSSVSEGVETGEKCLTCSNVTSGGTIGSSQTINTGDTPATLTNVTNPSGGTGAIEYMWLYSTNIPCPGIGDAAWQLVSGASSSTYSPGPLTQSTCFMRCSRRAGCVNWDGESNAVTITVTPQCSCPGNLITNPSFESGTTGWGWWGGNLQTGTYAAVCGANSGQFQIYGSDGGIYQDKTGIAPGTGINISVYAGVHNTNNYAQVGVQFYTSNWTYISEVSTEVNSQLPTMTLYNLTATVPPGTYYVRYLGWANGDWLKQDGICMTTETCTANITGLFFNDLTGTNDIAITNGGTYSYDDIVSNYNLEANITGTVESVVFRACWGILGLG